MVWALAAVATLLTACASPAGGPQAGTVSGPTGAQTSTGAAAEQANTLTVLAAASLREPFTRIASTFETSHPGLTVTLSFGGSSTLAQQVVAGAPADVLATASTTSMRIATSAGAVRDTTVFARNRITLVVPPTNPAEIRSVTDLADPSVRVVMCQPEVPCGQAAHILLTRADVAVEPASFEPDVTATATRVRLGEADAGFVYVTDLLAAGDELVGIPLPDRLAVWTDYPIAVVTASPFPDTAQAFVDTVTGPRGQRVLQDAGFAAPR